MPVNSRHPEYAASTDQWCRCRDVVAGADAVKKAGVKYLPMLEGDAADRIDGPRRYEAYKMRADFYGASGRTVEALAGVAFRKPTGKTDIPEAYEEQFEDVTLTDKSVDAVGLEALKELITTGRYGLLLDMPEEAVEGARPYWVPYKTEQIVNWREASVNGNPQPVLVVLEETTLEPDPKDQFVWISKTIYKVLELVKREGSNQLAYVSTIYTQPDKNKDEWVPGETVMAIRRGSPVPFIPIVVMNPFGLSICPEKAPILDLADMNLSHYRTSADYEHALHFCGTPQPWAAGVFLKPDEHLTIGSSQAWAFKDPQAKAGILQASSDSVGALATALERKETLMATLGGRLLERQQPGVEAADTVRMRHSGEQASLSTMTEAISQALTKMARWHLWWAGADESTADDATIRVNTDFTGVAVSADVLKVLLMAYQAGDIDFETWYAVLERAELTRPGATAADVQALIDAEQDKRVDLASKMAVANNPQDPNAPQPDDTTGAGPGGKPAPKGGKQPPPAKKAAA